MPFLLVAALGWTSPTFAHQPETQLKPRLALVGQKGGAHSLAFSPDGTLVVAGGRDKTVDVWEVGTGRVRASLVGHEGFVKCVAMSADGKSVASLSDESLRIWNVH